jgi:hypothetical protein
MGRYLKSPRDLIIREPLRCQCNNLSLTYSEEEAADLNSLPAHYLVPRPHRLRHGPHEASADRAPPSG